MNIPDELIDAYMSRLINRTDCWYRQYVKDGTARYACVSPDKDWYQPVTPQLVRRVIDGNLSCGWSALDAQGYCRWCCWDSDVESDRLDRIASVLRSVGLTPHREGRRPSRDGHMWLFFSKRIEAAALRSFNQEILAHAGVLTSEIEFFPKQTSAVFGNCVKAPLARNLKPEAAGAVGMFDEAPRQVLSQLEWLAEVMPDRSAVVVSIASAVQYAAPPVEKPVRKLRDDANLNILEYVSITGRCGRDYVARCPACALEGTDRHADNLRIAIADPRLFCCVDAGPGQRHRAADILNALNIGNPLH